MSERHVCKKFGPEYFDSAPYSFIAEEVVKATPEQIFEVFEDAHAWTVWALPIQKVEWTSPKPFGLGTTRTVYMMGGLVGYEEFIAWDPGKRMAFCFTHASMENIAGFGEDYQVEDLGNGSCRVTWNMVMEPKDANAAFRMLTVPMMRLANKFMFRKFRRYTEKRFKTA